MIVTAKDLRFNISALFDVISKGESVTITYRGKAKAKLTPINSNNGQEKDDSIFGMWSDRDDSVDEYVRNLRKGRDFAL